MTCPIYIRWIFSYKQSLSIELPNSAKFYVDNIIRGCFASIISKEPIPVSATIFDEWQPLKMMNNTFLFHLRNTFRSNDIQFLCPDLSYLIRQMLDKIRVNFINLPKRKTNNYTTNLSISQEVKAISQ